GQAMAGQEVVQEPVTAQHRLPDTDQDHPTDEIRQIDNRLDDPLRARVDQAVEQQRKRDRRREVEENLQAVDDERVGQRGADGRIVEECDEIIKADPRALEEAQIRRIVLEGDDIAEKRKIAKDYEENESWKNEGIHPTFSLHFRPDRRLRSPGNPRRCPGARRDDRRCFRGCPAHPSSPLFTADALGSYLTSSCPAYDPA